MTLDARVHRAVLCAIRDGRARTADALAAELGASTTEVTGALDRLAAGHGVVLHPGTHEVWIAHPFSCSPTGTWVAGAARGWWAPCLWCALGIAALVDEPVAIHARIGGEAEPIVITDDLLVHFARPPREAWANVVHFCAMVLPLRAAADIDAWSARHHLPRGEAVPVPQVRALAERWYGNHLAPDWVKWTTAQARDIFRAVGLTGAFWDLPGDGRF